MSNQYTMKIYPAGRGRDVYRNIEICGNSTLNQLCQIILKSFDFIDEHLYEFCMDNRMYSEYAYQSDPEGDEPSADITLDEAGSAKDRNLHFIMILGMIGCSLLRFQKSVKFREILSLVSLRQKEAFNSIQTGMKMSLTKNNVMFALFWKNMMVRTRQPKPK